ncbi:two-component system capsular synthesis sensor histidine kinase RcsC [Paraburkholderia caballeronis]|uniref:ATP-binding protein n=1 Tax=Paraburkholderia caballeronis TaxID=416943 RepID=UPI00106498D8|nr:ATP-binding protein [Paraburkholderia caballeronis]TDV23831.1 two-component system capsular synthesis sensor histidine kinase RcsC [Paraburkholderia caballeronis]
MTQPAARDPDAPPLRTFRSLDDNLRRERRVFTTVIALLVCATIAVAAVAIGARLAASLRTEEQLARLYDQTLADKILDRHSALTVASLILTLRANGQLPSTPVASDRPCLSRGAHGGEPALQASCNEAAQLLSSTGDGPPLQMILLGDGSAYLHQPPDADSPLPADDAALVSTVLARLAGAHVDPLAAARDKRVVWFAAPSAGRPTKEMIGASVVAKGEAPYAIVLTTLDLADLYTATGPDGREPQPLLLDSEGRLVIGTGSPPEAERINARLANRADGVFHWIPSYGWALRRAAPLSGFGHTLYLLPYAQQFSAMRGELLLIVAVAAALIVLLLSMYRYWNYRFLGRIYAQAYRALENEMLNHLLVHATPVGLCIVRRDALDIVVANPIARHVLGLSPADTRLPDALRDEFAARRQPAENPSDETTIAQFSFSMQRAPDDDVHLEITYAPAMLDREDVFFCAMTDITERHRAEQMLREAKLTSEAAAKAKVAFFASMSHELRTPLASLVGNIELVALGPLAPEQQARVRAMQVSAKGLLQIVNDVLDFSKIDVGELGLFEEWGSLADVLGRIATSHASLATRKGLRFYVVFDRNLPARLLFDPIRVSQIVNNLLGNAFKFTNSGKVVLRAQWADERAHLSVVDSGIGIPDELRQRLFQPFTQGSGSRLTQARGTGLGLSICARLCRLMNGTIELDSTVGVGTRVAVTLPLKTSSADRHAAEWTLPYRRPALLCRAPEYEEWLTGLFDPDASTVTTADDTREPLDPAAHDFAIVTDEFAENDVLAWWSDPRTIVWATQTGPLVPARRGDGGVEVSVYSLPGLRHAARSIGAQARPAAPGETGAAVPAADVAQPAPPLTVLIAEDNLLNRNLLRDQLTTLGAQVVEAAQGDEAIALFDRQPVDAVFTDIDMPALNGYEVLEKLRARRPSIPVFAVSASALPEDIAEGRARGFTDYLTKPVPLAVLTVALESVRDAPAAAAPRQPDVHPALPDAGLPDIPAISPEFAQAFVEQSRADLAELASVVSARSLAGLRHWLHRVCGGLAVLGASKLLDDSQRLREEAARAAAWTDDIEQRSLAIGDVLEEMQSQLIRQA